MFPFSSLLTTLSLRAAIMLQTSVLFSKSNSQGPKGHGFLPTFLILFPVSLSFWLSVSVSLCISVSVSLSPSPHLTVGDYVHTVWLKDLSVAPTQLPGRPWEPLGDRPVPRTCRHSCLSPDHALSPSAFPETRLSLVSNFLALPKKMSSFRTHISVGLICRELHVFGSCFFNKYLLGHEWFQVWSLSWDFSLLIFCPGSPNHILASKCTHFKGLFTPTHRYMKKWKSEGCLLGTPLPWAHSLLPLDLLIPKSLVWVSGKHSRPLQTLIFLTQEESRLSNARFKISQICGYLLQGDRQLRYFWPFIIWKFLSFRPLKNT